MHQYQAALHSFLEAQHLSESAGEPGVAAAWEANLASLYAEMGEYDAAAEWTERSLARISGHHRTEHMAKLQIQLATLRARQRRMGEAFDLFRQGIQGADQAGDLAVYAMGWNRLGEELLKQGDLASAEGALVEAFRVRKLHHLPLDTSYRSVGRLRLEQGDLVSASALLDRAVELAAAPTGLMPTWDIFHTRGRVRLAQGRLTEALADLRIARRLGRAWRWSAPTDDTTQLGAEGMLDRVYGAYIEAGNRLFADTRDLALAVETFEANEENRAASLRALLEAPKPTRPEMPEGYWAVLSHLQQAEIKSLRTGNGAAVSAARAEWVRMEASLGANVPAEPTRLVDAVRSTLEPGTALLSFHLGASGSWLWAIDRHGLELYELPPQPAIAKTARHATAAIREGREDAAETSAQLYDALFGRMAPRFQKASRWLLVLDDVLFEVPIAALVDGHTKGRYVAENHELVNIPGAAFWLQATRRAPQRLSPLFLGVGDPIYNQADVRAGGFASKGGNALPLPRLVGSGEEIDACARSWKGPSVLLRGARASREGLIEELRSSPAVVHVATHYLESAAGNRYGLIALTLGPGQGAELLTPYEISEWKIRAGVVVLSGCHSAAGAPLPGTGVAGLGRAWLAAGAQSVVGSLWNVADDNGAFFQPLYRKLQASASLDAPQALRQAQLEMIHSTDYRAQPAYWGAYFVLGTQRKAYTVP
jgi:CHAT domain-containing protein